MSRREIKNPAASVRQRLLDLSRQRGEVFQLLLTRYALERFLYRLSLSEHAESFVLKGAFRFMAWTGEVHRPTKDLDLTGFGDESPGRLGKIVSEICWLQVIPDDGLEFDAGYIKIEAIREDQVYQGLRVNLLARLGKSEIPMQIDVGFGDAVTPEPERIDYPTLLDLPAPKIMAYPKESVIAEKSQAMVALGMPNSRMKDFYDLWTMSKVFTFEGPMLVKAIQATFQRRRTEIPKDEPTGLSDEFAQDTAKSRQWKAFVERIGLETGGADLPSVIADLREFLLKPLQAAANGRKFRMVWSPGGHWRE